ncbi:MAG: glycosyltransferase family 4 protein [Anaerolineae bacterium]
MTPRVASFPSLASMSANPYWALLARGLRERGWGVDDEAAAQFGASWLRANRGRVDVLHFHYVQQYYGYEQSRARLNWVLRLGRNLLLARLWGYRVVYTLHDLTPTFPLNPRLVNELGHWLAANCSTAVIVHCGAAREALRQKYGRRSAVYTVAHPMLSGVYANSLTSREARARLSIAPESTVYLFFGGLRPSKGIDALCAAFRKVKDPGAVLLIAGAPSPPESHMEALRAAAAVDRRIRLIEGFVPDEQVSLYMNAADVVVLPFAQVLTSSSAILSLSFGKPVIAPRMGCLPELVTDDLGVLYNPDDVQGLARALVDIRGHDLAAMGEFARQRVREYTVERFVDDTLSAYGVGG